MIHRVFHESWSINMDSYVVSTEAVWFIEFFMSHQVKHESWTLQLSNNDSYEEVQENPFSLCHFEWDLMRETNPIRICYPSTEIRGREITRQRVKQIILSIAQVYWVILAVAGERRKFLPLSRRGIQDWMKAWRANPVGQSSIPL